MDQPGSSDGNGQEPMITDEFSDVIMKFGLWDEPATQYHWLTMILIIFRLLISKLV
jgi:hypothetical protein